MPELPEVETIVRALQPVLTGKTIRRFEFLHPRVTRHSSPEQIRQEYIGSIISDLRRRGKYILIQFRQNPPDLAIHLKMSGQLLLSEEELVNKHLRAVIHLNDGLRLNFVDIRTFGYIFIANQNAPQGFLSLGIEPLSSSFTARRLEQLLSDKKTEVKTLLLHQDLVAGIGNIYASEICFLAGIHPERKGNILSKEEFKRLHRSIRKILQEAIFQMGTTFSNYRRPNGEAGMYSNQLQVYGRESEPCYKCQTKIIRIVQHGRSTFYCPLCQQ